MIINNNVVKSNLQNYVNKDAKIARDIRDGKLIRIINGLYETDATTPGYLLASSIYGPSYISFEYALSLYGFIPERVSVITSATFNKKKKKEFNTPFGIFTYRDIPKLAYPEEVILKEENGYAYQIASEEKAICDKLYTLKPIKNYKDLEQMLFEDIRIDREKFNELNINKIEKLSNLYHSRNVKLLAKYMRRNTNE